MKLINPDVTILPQSKGLEGVYKQIEIAGRTCYKSEDKITEDSCEEFVQRMINNGHTAMLEHGTVYLKVPINEWISDKHEWEYMFPPELPWVDTDFDKRYAYITTNYRHIVEEKIKTGMIQKYWSEPTEFHEKRITARFTCDRGVSHKRFVA